MIKDRDINDITNINTPQACVRCAEIYDAPLDIGLRVILSHGTFVHLLEYALDEESPFYEQMIGLLHRAYVPGYDFSTADKALIIDYISPYMKSEWELGDKCSCEGRFETLWTEDPPLEDDNEEDVESADVKEPVPVLLLQHFTGDHHDADNGIYNWYMDLPGTETDCLYKILNYRKLDSLKPQIVKILTESPEQ